jgi:crotonobetaine/carnitine-CoA ligase
LTAAFEVPLARLLLDTAAARPEAVLLSGPDFSWSVGDAARRALDLAAALAGAKIGLGDRVAVMLDNHPDHVAAILALGLLGAVWIPLNTRFKAAGVAPILDRTKPAAALTDAAYRDILLEAGHSGPVLDPADVAQGFGDGVETPRLPAPDDTRAILFTSGTTGAPKGVIVTERMLSAAGHFAGEVSEARPGDVYLFWEPLHHVGGAQMVPMAIARGARLAMVPRFSASRYWDEARAAGATRIHYLGGILDILMKQPASAADRAHKVELGFGAGAKPALWRDFESRFGVRLVEVYGMTEASSFSTANRAGVVGSVGRPLPEFDVEILDDDGNPAAPTVRGEIALRARPKSLITPGYLDDPAATAAAWRDGRFLTGDLGWRDAEGNLYYAGRKKDSIRCRGENVSAWEVEQVLNAHPAVKESAAVGVAAEVGEEDILAYVIAVAEVPAPEDLIAWCTERLAPFQVPRYIAFVTDLPHTPTERIRKNELARDPSGAWDRLGSNDGAATGR